MVCEVGWGEGEGRFERAGCLGKGSECWGRGFTRTRVFTIAVQVILS